jgi:hypothetical protein
MAQLTAKPAPAAAKILAQRLIALTDASMWRLADRGKHLGPWLRA